MQNNILVSIVIPCFNDAQYIEQAVNSALNQSYPYKEIIVVDDGSNIETKAVLQKLLPIITKLITQENQGQSTARNMGIREAKGEYILVLDSDDYFEPSFCEKAVLVLKDTNIKIVACHIVRFNNEKKIDEFRHKGGDLSVLILNNQATGSVMFRKNDFIKIGGYDQLMRTGLEDWEFYIRILQNGGLFYIIKEPLFNYRMRSDSTTSKANLLKYELLNYIYTKHRDLNIAYFDLFVGHLLYRIEREEIEKIKNTQRLEFKIGKAILKPFRWIKSLIK
ncbi:glycosyltransferase [Flavobacterium sp. GT3P67]|uniref:glycosyltransferase n=1 Tax=Flavobacterium sp. GT3P67 TaxID=2541722 RepID=UPI0010464686|nr:glycosyltransferase [Flavobacterium sp. GT3P67]TDE53941.1 glycosyltransferase [Flavobacterium sp. GT3P67]